MGKEERYFMGIDVGTYESKGVLIDKDCRSSARLRKSMDWKIRAPAGTSMMQKQFGGAMFVRSLACCWNDPAWIRHRSSAWACPPWAAIVFR